ncbi:MAG TPA: hypothetical protein VFS69_03730 [Sphingomicrobium sp.]|nr:hypothetical protein [Sphingomicrobium sp.]
MAFEHLAWVAVAAFAMAGIDAQQTCSIENGSSPAGEWKFVRAYDAVSGEVVLRQAIKAGDSKSVTVSGEEVRLEYKLAGDKDYHSAQTAQCKGGNTIRI